MANSSYFKQEKKGKENELNSYRRRKQQLEAIQNTFQNSFYSYADSITAKGEKVKQFLEEGIKTTGGSVELGNIFKRETGTNEGSLNQARFCIKEEIRCVQEKIADTEEQIRDLDARMRSEKAKEDEERRKALQMALGK